MKSTNISLLVMLLLLLLTQCEQSEIAVTSEKKVTANDGERISYLKKSAFTYELTQNQQPFELKYAGIYNDSTVFIQIVYQTTTDYKLHEFDFVWDEKLVRDNEGKTWMNFEVYHKSNPENATVSISDSVKVVIPDLLKIEPATLSNLWLRFNNSISKNNSIVLQYTKIRSIEESSASDDSTINSGEVTLPKDSIGTGNTTNPGNGGTLPADSLNTGGINPGGGTVNPPLDSIPGVGATIKDSINPVGEIQFDKPHDPERMYFQDIGSEKYRIFTESLKKQPDCLFVIELRKQMQVKRTEHSLLI